MADTADLAALQWYLDNGLSDVAGEMPIDRLSPVRAVSVATAPVLSAVPGGANVALNPPLGAAEARQIAVNLALAANNVQELQAAILQFEGISLKKTATQLVFADGNPAAYVMVIGDTPGAEDDRAGKPFMGENGQLLDKMFGAIGLSRTAEDPAKALYISNLVNWRPPGNRSPSPAEIEVSLPFIERHIQLVAPRLLVLCGAVAAQALLGRSDGISKLRRSPHEYSILSPELGQNGPKIPAYAIFHPSNLIRLPEQKKAAWEDLQAIQVRISEL